MLILGKVLNKGIGKIDWNTITLNIKAAVDYCGFDGTYTDSSQPVHDLDIDIPFEMDKKNCIALGTFRKEQFRVMESRRLHAGEEWSFRHGIYMGSGTPGRMGQGIACLDFLRRKRLRMNRRICINLCQKRFRKPFQEIGRR